MTALTSATHKFSSNMPYSCDHCKQTTFSFWPSGGEDIICKVCFDKYSREQEDEEEWEDYTSRHPYYVTMSDGSVEYNPHEMTKRFLARVKDTVPEILKFCKENIQILQEKERQSIAKINSYIAQLENISES